MLNATTSPVLSSFFGDCFFLLGFGARKAARVPNSDHNPFASSSLIFWIFFWIFCCSGSRSPDRIDEELLICVDMSLGSK